STGSALRGGRHVQRAIRRVRVESDAHPWDAQMSTTPCSYAQSYGESSTVSTTTPESIRSETSGGARPMRTAPFLGHGDGSDAARGGAMTEDQLLAELRSEERRVGKEGRARWWPQHWKKRR